MDPGNAWLAHLYSRQLLIQTDRMFRFQGTFHESHAFTQVLDVDAFRKRQEADRSRYSAMSSEGVQRRVPFHMRFNPDMTESSYLTSHYYEQDHDPEEYTSDTDEDTPEHHGSRQGHPDQGEEGWRNSEGERLADFGVDEDVEFYDEDDLPLAELLRRKKETPGISEA